jgi:hypothetical protein
VARSERDTREDAYDSFTRTSRALVFRLGLIEEDRRCLQGIANAVGGPFWRGRSRRAGGRRTEPRHLRAERLSCNDNRPAAREVVRNRRVRSGRRVRWWRRRCGAWPAT